MASPTSASTEKSDLSHVQVGIFEHIYNDEVDSLRALLSKLTESVDCCDENGMTPLQHAAYKGNKELVQMFLDRGADVNSSKHQYNYTALHFAALSGNAEICLMLLLAGANPTATNSVGRTAAQMAAFVSNHQVVLTINQFVPQADVEYYTQLQGLEPEPLLPVILLEPFHRFLIQTNLHPVRVALNLQRYGPFTEDLKRVKKLLDLMTEREFKRRNNPNEVIAFKYHYLGWIVGEIIKCRDHFQARREQGTEVKSDSIELFAKRVLKEAKHGQIDYLEYMIRECVREFPYRECSVFRQVVTQLANKERMHDISALTVIKGAIHGQRGFVDAVPTCSSCGEENPDKKCSKCKRVQYCDRECQRLHWFMHKKNCARPNGNGAAPSIGDKEDLSKNLTLTGGDTIDPLDNFVNG